MVYTERCHNRALYVKDYTLNIINQSIHILMKIRYSALNRRKLPRNIKKYTDYLLQMKNDLLKIDDDMEIILTYDYLLDYKNANESVKGLIEYVEMEVLQDGATRYKMSQLVDV